MKSISTNPFLITGYQGPDYFCDREKETASLMSALKNGRNITLISPRRMGKTGLIKNVFYYIQKENKSAACFYLDIFSTQNLQEFVSLLGRSVLGKLDTLSQSTLKSLFSFFKSCRPVISANEITGMPSVTLDFIPERSEETLKEIFTYLNQSGVECYIAIDEFQQIMEYPEKGVEGLLRSYIQFTPNVHFIFSGSKKHLMNELFEKKSLPFYKFGDAIYLPKIGTSDWVDYICGRFEATGKQISIELAEKICQIVDNHSSYVQQLAWLVWIHTDGVATEQDFEAAYQDIIDQNTPLFEKQTESLTTYQMNFLRAILDGVHNEFTTQEVLQKYKLGSSANVSIIKRALVKKELIEIEKRQVVIPDPVMKVWLKKELGV